MARKFQFVVYKITFPNGKIYIGKDVGNRGHTIRYFGSWSYDWVEGDFSKEELMDFTIRREIIYEGTDRNDVSRMEIELIRKFRSNDPNIGYNRRPKFRADQ